jgi:hypothetical protein
MVPTPVVPATFTGGIGFDVGGDFESAATVAVGEAASDSVQPAAVAELEEAVPVPGEHPQWQMGADSSTGGEKGNENENENEKKSENEEEASAQSEHSGNQGGLWQSFQQKESDQARREQEKAALEIKRRQRLAEEMLHAEEVEALRREREEEERRNAEKAEAERRARMEEQLAREREEQHRRRQMEAADVDSFDLDGFS